MKIIDMFFLGFLVVFSLSAFLIVRDFVKGFIQDKKNYEEGKASGFVEVVDTDYHTNYRQFICYKKYADFDEKM